MLKGISASPGIGIGKAFVIEKSEIRAERQTVRDAKSEMRRFERAIDVFCAQLAQAVFIASESFGEDETGIITSQILIAQDEELYEKVKMRVEENNENAELAFANIMDGYILHFSAFEDELLRSRTADLHDVKNRLLSILTGNPFQKLEEIPEGCILVAEDIYPSIVAFMRPKRIAAIATGAGAAYSHLAILARSVRIPAVLAANGLLSQVKNGDGIIVNGATGEIILNPSAEDMRRYLLIKSRQDQACKRLESFKKKKTVTNDGKRVRLSANLTVLNELPDIADNGADGIGLFRTEYIYADAAGLPDEEQQFFIYKTIAQAMDGKPVNIRTLDADAGGEKSLPCLNLAKEDNPSLGLRAVRYSLDDEEVFKVQLNALLRASAFGGVNILVPMITVLEELRKVRELLEACKAGLARRGVDFDVNIRLGIMIETPAAALCARALAREADFFSLGTNDLTQYTLAADRNNRKVSNLYNVFHPAVLRLIYQAIQAARDASIPAGICGEAAAEPLMTPFLIGCGIDQLSVRNSSVLTIREHVGNISYSYWRRQVPKILALATAGEVVEYIKARVRPPEAVIVD